MNIWKLTIPILFLVDQLVHPFMDLYKVVHKEYPNVMVRFFNDWHLKCYPEHPMMRIFVAYKKAEKLEQATLVALNGKHDPVLDEIRAMKLELEIKIKQLADA